MPRVTRAFATAAAGDAPSRDIRGILDEMSEAAADAGVVQSRAQLERLIAEDELAGRTISGFSAASAHLRSLDLDNVTFERVDVRGADGDEARLERAELRQCDLRTSHWKGALW